MIKKAVRRIFESPTLMNWINQGAVFVHGIFITSLILIKFPNLDYSFWMLLKTLTAFGILAEAGLGRTIERSVAFFFSGAAKLPRNKKEYDAHQSESDTPNIEQLAQLLYTTKYIYLIVSGAMVLLLTTAGIGFLWNLFTQSGHDPMLWIAYGLMILQSSLMLQSIKWKSFMTGTRHLVELYRISTIFSVVRIFGFLALLLGGFGVAHLMGYLLVEQIISYGYFRGFVVRWFRSQGLILGRSFRLNRDIFSSLWSVSWKTGLNTWGFFFTNRGVELITSQLKDTTLMASFLFTTSILRFIRNIAQVPITVKYPEIYGLMAGKRFDKVKQIASPRIYLSLLIMSVGFIGFGVTGNWLLDLIGAESKSLVPATIFILMSVYLLFETNALIHGTIYISTNAVPFLIPGLITGIATFIFGSLILPKWGLLGLVILQVTLNFGNNFWYSTYLSLKLVHWPLKDYLLDVFIKGPAYWVSRARASGFRSS
jgi:O-antigen/teichoic acid export membrane protein